MLSNAFISAVLFKLDWDSARKTLPCLPLRHRRGLIILCACDEHRYVMIVRPTLSILFLRTEYVLIVRIKNMCVCVLTINDHMLQIHVRKDNSRSFSNGVCHK